MEDFPQEPPRFWIALGLLCAALVLAVVMSVVPTVDAHAQQKCAALSATIDELGNKHGEIIVWEGTMPTPSGAPVEAMLFQSPKGTWTLVAVQGTTACFMAAGANGTPIETGRGV